MLLHQSSFHLRTSDGSHLPAAVSSLLSRLSTPASVIRKCKCNSLEAHVCFAGDSQMRHIYGMTDAVMKSMTIIINGKYKTIAPPTWSRYIHVLYGNELEEADIGNCSHIVVNIGQWPIGWRVGARPWTVQQYAERADTIIQVIRRRAPGLKETSGGCRHIRTAFLERCRHS